MLIFDGNLLNFYFNMAFRINNVGFSQSIYSYRIPVIFETAAPNLD